MYFITNSEGYIVAASKELLDKIGYRDICSVALAVKNRQFDIDSKNKEIKISDDSYLYSISNMFSAFGELSLYNLTAQSDLTIKEDDSIEYLKKIKEGSILKDDNNFNIPSIISDKKEPESSKDNLKTSINEIDSSDKNLEIIEKVEEEYTQNESKLEVSTLKEDSKSENNLEILEVDSYEPKESKEEKVIDDSVASLLKDIEDIESPTDIKDDIEKPQFTEEKVTTIDIYSDKKEEKILDESIDTLKDSEDNIKEKRGTLSKIKSKLFPWGIDKGSKEIELEESSSEKLELFEESSKINCDKTLEGKIEKDITKSVEADELASNIPINIPEIKEEHLIKEEKEDNSNVEFTDNSSKSIDLLNIDKDELLDDTQGNKHLTESIVEIEKEISKIHSEPEENKELQIEDKEFTILEEIEEIEVKKEPEKLDTDTLILKETATTFNTINEEKVVPKQDFLHKIISIQVGSINLEDNAKKLSIDLDNYKLLLENFLDELDNYKSDLKDGVDSTIAMLIDASELLSLNIVTDKLKKLSTADNKNALKEIDLTKQFLREKLTNSNNKTLEEIATKEEKLEVTKEVTTEPETSLDNRVAVKDIVADDKDIIDTQMEIDITTPPIPEEAIDITTAKELLEKITLTKIDFDPERAVSELNLPKSLILEFVNDFILQAKDHLDQLVDAFKQSDLKTLQATAHMLKGAAGNLRLDSIAELLFKIQKSNNIEESGELLKRFVSNLKGLEYEVEVYEKESNED